MKHKIATIAVGLGLAAALVLPGCQPASTKIAVGKVDTALLLKDDPDYQSLSIEYLKESTDVRKSFVDRMKKANNDKEKLKKIQGDYIKKQQEFEKKWKEKRKRRREGKGKLCFKERRKFEFR